MAVTLCHVDDIPERGAKGFDLPGVKIFAVKQRRQIFIYLNRCPHAGLPLEWEEDAFMDAEGQFIKCANHGALFVPETGECIQGPCSGDFLWQIEFSIDDGIIVIGEEELPAPAAPT